MNKKNVSTKRVPSIRVVGFTDEWEQRKLGDITKYKNGTAHEENVQSQGPFELITLKSVSEEGTIQSSGKFLASTDEALDAGSLVMVLSEQTPGAVGMTALVPLNHRYVLNQRVAQLSVDKKNVNPAFLSKAINRNQHYFELRSGGTKVQNISKSSVLDYKFYMPPREEQDKLAIFLLCIEETIALHQQKSEALKKVYRWAKRNLLPMPKESSPQIHIKNNNENWTTRKLGNILKPNTEKNRDHKFNLVESVSNKYGLVKQTDQFKDYEVASKDTHNYYVIRPTTFVYNPSRINVRSIGYKKAGDPVSIVSPLYVSFQANSDIDDSFLWIWLHSSQFNNERRILSTGSVRTTLSYEQLCLANITYPDIEEQREIAQFFVSLETRIDLELSVINYLKRVKRWALDNMFV